MLFARLLTPLASGDRLVRNASGGSEMSRHQRRKRTRRIEHRRVTAAKRTVLAGAGLSLGVTLATGASADAATFTATNLNDSGAGSLRQAILDANTAPGADQVTFQSSLS